MEFAKGRLLAALAVGLAGCGFAADGRRFSDDPPDRVFMLLGTESTGRLLPE